MRIRSHRLPGVLSYEHVFELPLDHRDSAPDAPRIEVFARELVAPARRDEALPWLVFLQGGPGFESPRPASAAGWVERALREYRVLLLDQRGTGRSTPIDTARLLRLGDAQTQARTLQHFRADSIVADCEAIRRQLLGDGGRWSLLGQSFGGFCALTYLSFAPEGLEEVFITGGLAPLDAGAQTVYERTSITLRERNRAFYERFPENAARLEALCRLVESEELRLPGGDRLSARRLQTLGPLLGSKLGDAALHYLIEAAFPGRGDTPRPTQRFLSAVESATAFDTNPIYALLHEPCYAQQQAPAWAAQRVVDGIAELQPSHRPFPFLGEMVFPWFFEEMGALRPLREAAELLAQREDWPALYDLDQLARNEIPVGAAVYFNDFYVDRELSLRTAEHVGNCRVWVTSEHEHDALRKVGAPILSRVIALARGEA